MEIMRISGADVIPAGFSVNNQQQEEPKAQTEVKKEPEKAKETTIDTYA
ncbi:MAG TPA: hypothetical protein PK348_07480 [Spirochaetota bacterium]|nr:hypothetical protein [Spirochaetota bacterium]